MLAFPIFVIHFLCDFKFLKIVTTFMFSFGHGCIFCVCISSSIPFCMGEWTGPTLLCRMENAEWGSEDSTLLTLIAHSTAEYPSQWRPSPLPFLIFIDSSYSRIDRRNGQNAPKYCPEQNGSHKPYIYYLLLEHYLNDWVK
jgi:hypothetical protein